MLDPTDYPGAIIPQYKLGQVVYYKIGEDRAGIVIGLYISYAGIEYDVRWADGCQDMYFAFELSSEKNYGNN